MRVLAGCGCIAALALGGCGLGDRYGVGTGATPPLTRVLVTAEETPGKQSLLYTALREAEAAAQSASKALAAVERPADATGYVGEVLYAVDPAAAPNWRAKSAGFVPGWPAKGYGVRPAVVAMTTELEAATGSDAAAGQSLVCLANTQERADQLVALAGRALDAEPGRDLLAKIEELARALNAGQDQDGDGVVGVSAGECGLQRIHRLLEPVVLARRVTES